MSKSVLDTDGLIYLWSKIKTLVTDGLGNKVDKVTGKGLSTNDFTDAYKDKLDLAKTSVAWDDVTGKPDFSTIYRYKGSVATKGDLPTSNNVVGDTYNVESDGMNWAWNGTEWDNLGSIIEINSITNSQIDSITV